MIKPTHTAVSHHSSGPHANLKHLLQQQYKDHQRWVKKEVKGKQRAAKAMKRVQEKEEKCHEEEKHYLTHKKREVEAFLAEEATLQAYKEELDAEEEEVLEEGWSGAEWC